MSGETYGDELDAERTRMIGALRGMKVDERKAQQGAVVELARRLHGWRGTPVVHDRLVPRSRERSDFVAELLIVRAISPRKPPTFGVAPDGAAFVGDKPRICVAGLSPALDQAARIYTVLTQGRGGHFIERDGKFFDKIPNGQNKAFAFVKPGTVRRGQRVRELFGAGISRGHNALRRATGTPNPPPLVVLFQAGPWPPEGVLSEMGYHVGMVGVPEDERRKILRDVMVVELVPASPNVDGYVAQWGVPGSAQRFSKTYGCLTKFIDLAERKTHVDMSTAIEDWKKDLQWLDLTLRHRYS